MTDVEKKILNVEENYLQLKSYLIGKGVLDKRTKSLFFLNPKYFKQCVIRTIRISIVYGALHDLEKKPVCAARGRYVE